MVITTITKEGVEQKIHLFDEPTDLDSLIVNVTVPDDLDAMLDSDRKRWDGQLRFYHWRNLLLALPGPNNMNPELNSQELDVDVISSFHVLASRAGLTDENTPLAINGLIITADNKIDYGLRGGDVEAGNVHIAPAGMLAYTEGRNPISNGFYAEARSEVALQRDEISDTLLIGYQTFPKSRDVNLVVTASTSVRSEELKLRHKKAWDLYAGAMREGIPERKAREAIAEADLPNVDAWEHVKHVYLDNDPDVLNRIVASRQVEMDGKTYELLDVGRAPLILHLEQMGELDHSGL